MRNELTILTQTDQGRVVSGVELFVRDGVRIDRLGVTDSSGRLVALPPGHLPAFLIARRSGLRTTAVRLVAPLPRTLLVQLSADEILEGHVVRCDGTVPEAGTVTVIAWPASVLEPPLADVREAAPTCLRTTTDEGGYFRIGGLGGSAEYKVIAAAPGWMSRVCSTHASNLGDHSEDHQGQAPVLELEALHAVRIELKEKGLPLELASSFLPDPGPTPGPTMGLRVHPSVAKHVDVPWFVSEIVGLSSDDYRYSLAARTHTLLAACGTDTVGPLPFVLSILSYEPVDVSVFAPRLDQGLATTRVDLISSAEGRGELAVEIRGLPDALLGGDSRLTGAATLTLVDEAERELRFMLDDLTKPAHRLGGIPFGRYRVGLSTRPFSIESIAGSLELHPAIAEVGLFPAHVELDLHGACAALRLGLEGDGGRPYTGPATAVLVRVDEDPDSGHGGSVFFRGRPYGVQLLPPGRYGVRLLHPPAPSGGVSYAEVEVHAGETTQVPFHVVDQPLENALLAQGTPR